MKASGLLICGILFGIPIQLSIHPESRVQSQFPGSLRVETLHAQSAAESGASSGDQLDREFYNDYLDQLPNEWAPDAELLKSNLFAALKRVLPREDPFDGPAYLKKLQPDGLEYKRVTTDSPFIRGLFREAGYLKKTKYMWIVKSGPYMIFLTYQSDPERYTVAEYQNLVIKKKPAGEQSGQHKDQDS